MLDTDWKAIRTEYEQGELSQSAIAKKYGVSRTAIQKRAMKEAWQVAGCRLQVAGVTTPLSATKPTPLSLPMDAHSIARIGLRQLALHLQADGLLEIRDHKSLSDALAQYVKVLSTTLQEEQEPQDGLVIPLDRLSAHARMEIRRILVEEDERQREEHIG